MVEHDTLFAPGLPLTEVITIADRHTLAVQSWLASRSPDAARWQGIGIRASSTGIGVPLLNLALGFHFPSGTPNEAVDAEIESLKTFFAGRGVPWYWWMSYQPQPVNVRARLEKHGFIYDRPPLPAMVTPLPAQFQPYDSAIQVWQAATRADLEAASTIRRTAFRFPPNIALDYFEAMSDSWLSGDPARLYLARSGDEPPAAIGALIMGEGVPGVYVMATLPDYGRRGLGKAILTRILIDAAADGHRLIVLTASRFGFPLYAQFGFKHLFDFDFFRLPD